MKREPRDLAARFLTKAAQDEAAVRVFLREQQVADEIVAFHAQQAIEKALTPCAVLYRYEESPEIGEPLDREGVFELISRVRTWAEEVIRAR